MIKVGQIIIGGSEQMLKLKILTVSCDVERDIHLELSTQKKYCVRDQNDEV